MAQKIPRSLRLSLKGRHKADEALLSLGTKADLAADVNMSRTTINKFFKGEKVARQNFHKICKALKLDLQEVVESPEIYGLVQEVREHILPDIKQRCGTMRVLDMEQPIELGKIYTHVNILEKITGRRWREIPELMQGTDPENFDRFCLGNVKEKRVSGLDSMAKFSKLMILGKPGAGKTTFLKHLAIQCIGGKFEADRVPVFVTLKDFAEKEGQPDLLKYIEQWMPPGVAQHTLPILRAGRTLILLDGLDEVRDADSSWVLKQIRDFSQRFPENQFVITCRIAAQEYTFEQFTEVEIADFDNKQIADFSSKWFHSKDDPIKAKRFMEKLEEEEPIKELATNPLLLTLLCLVFEDSGSFSTNRAELYQMGVDVLLRKWDAKRNIQRQEVYKRLSVKRKEDLLSHIASTTFEAGNYFFKRREVAGYINHYIQNLPGASTDPDALELDSVAVLKSIEAQHGLLTERARNIYSFSHLTFHEYFTARKIMTSCNPYVLDDQTLKSLVSHLTDKRWREVFLLTVGMLDSADTLLKLMKDKIDLLLAWKQKLQMFLEWVYFQAKSCNFSDEIARIKQFNEHHFVRNFPSIIYATHNYSGRVLFHLQLGYIDGRVIILAIINSNILNLDCNFELACSLYKSLIDALISHVINISNILEMLDILNLFDILDDINILEFELLQKELQDMGEMLPNPYGDAKFLREWWLSNGKSWYKNLKTAIAARGIIWNDWQFSETQEKLLQQYYDANEFLLTCLHGDCYVSREVRQEIEDTLFLPIALIEERQKS